MNEENFRKQLLFRCWHRGTREMDLILGRFAEARIPDMSNQKLQELSEFLQESDVDIYNWISNKDAVPDGVDVQMLEELKQFHNM